MEQDTEQEINDGGEFACSVCGMSEHYSYKGKEPPFCKKIRLVAESYVMKDPFSPPNSNQFLILGSDCSLCKNPVCQDCSIFYCKPFCLTCAHNNIDHFPQQVKAKLNSIKTE